MAFHRLLTALVLIHSTGGLFGADERSSIIWWKIAAKGSWPWIVHINITSDGVYRWGCCGTILNREWLLTAAHCWDPKLKADLRQSLVWVGSHNLQKGAVRYMGILHVIRHNEYRAVGNGYVNDIALLKLKKKITFSVNVAPVSLPSIDDTFDSSSECWFTGWGNFGNYALLLDPEILQQLKVPIIPQIVCKVRYPKLTADMMCAGNMAGEKDTCKCFVLPKRDYGGPLVCRAGSGFVQVGVMSYGSLNGCTFPGSPGIFTQVSKHLRFINDYIHRR